MEYEELEHLQTILNNLEPTSELHASMVKAITIVNPSKSQMMINNLSHFVSEDNLEKTLRTLEEQEKIDGTIMADDIITMWEPLENRYTVSELLNEIS